MNILTKQKIKQRRRRELTSHWDNIITKRKAYIYVQITYLNQIWRKILRVVISSSKWT